MRFSVQTPRPLHPAQTFCALYLSLNTPVVAIDELPVGPARAGIALRERSAGSLGLEIAVRALRTGHVIVYAPADPPAAGSDAGVVVEAALTFAEGMGFLFDENELAARSGDGPKSAEVLWRQLVEAAPARAWAAEAGARTGEAPEEVLSKFRLIVGGPRAARDPGGADPAAATLARASRSRPYRRI